MWNNIHAIQACCIYIASKLLLITYDNVVDVSTSKIGSTTDSNAKYVTQQQVTNFGPRVSVWTSAYRRLDVSWCICVSQNTWPIFNVEKHIEIRIGDHGSVKVDRRWCNADIVFTHFGLFEFMGESTAVMRAWMSRKPQLVNTSHTNYQA